LIDFLKILISNFIKMRPVAAELFHAGRWTDMNSMVAFRNFSKAHKNTPLMNEQFVITHLRVHKILQETEKT